MSHLFTPKFTSNGIFTAIEDSTYITFSFNGTDRFRVVKSTGNFQAQGGVESGWGE